MKEISIIVPVYNVEKYLQICIESIIAQTFTDFELILIDDGSTDNSAAICDEYAKQDDRICVIHKENQGVGAARNQGLDICTGKYICFIDSDDYIEKDYLEYLYNRINVSEYDFVSCCANFVDENNNFIMKNEYSKSEFSIEKENIFDIYMHTNFIEDVAWNKIYRSTVFENLRYVEGIIYEDSELIIRLLKQVNKVLFTNKLKYNYRIRSGSILNYNGPNVAKKIFTYKKLDLLKVYELIYFELKETQYEKKYIKKSFQAVLNYGKVACMRKRI